MRSSLRGFHAPGAAERPVFELSNNIIQKGLAFGRDWSGTVVNPERMRAPNSHDFRPRANPRSARSAALLVRQIRPSSMNRIKRSQRRSI
jgi:hypothetical protein